MQLDIVIIPHLGFTLLKHQNVFKNYLFFNKCISLFRSIQARKSCYLRAKKGTFVSIPFPNRLVSLCMIHSSQRSLMNYLGTASQSIHRLNQAILSFAPSVLPRKIKGLSSRWVFTGRAVCLKSLIILISYIIWH